VSIDCAFCLCFSTLHRSFQVELTILVKLPHFAAHLQKDVVLGRLGPEDGLCVFCNETALHFLPSDVESLDLSAHARVRDFLFHIDALAHERPFESPHVAATQVLLFEADLHEIERDGFGRYLCVCVCVCVRTLSTTTKTVKQQRTTLTKQSRRLWRLNKSATYLKHFDRTISRLYVLHVMQRTC